jgi:hypothetical protein
MPPINAPGAKKAAPAAEFKSPEGVRDDADVQADVEDVQDDAPVPANELGPTADDFTFVRMPDGSVRAVRNDSIQTIGAFDSTAGVPEVPDEEVYVHLANGDVEQMRTSRLPGAAGTNAPYGYFERDNKVHHIIGVYPIEHEKG